MRWRSSALPGSADALPDVLTVAGDLAMQLAQLGDARLDLPHLVRQEQVVALEHGAGGAGDWLDEAGRQSLR